MSGRFRIERVVTAFSAAFHRLDQRWRAVPAGSRLMIATYTHLEGRGPRSESGRGPSQPCGFGR